MGSETAWGNVFRENDKEPLNEVEEVALKMITREANKRIPMSNTLCAQFSMLWINGEK